CRGWCSAADLAAAAGAPGGRRSRAAGHSANLTSARAGQAPPAAPALAGPPEAPQRPFPKTQLSPNQSRLTTRLASLGPAVLRTLRRGIEKEGLRATTAGDLALTS